MDNHLSSSLRQSTRRSHTDLKTMDSETCRAAFFSHSFKSTYKVVDDCREEEPERKQRPAYLHLSKKHLKGSDVLSETVAHTKSAYPIKHCGNLKGGEGLLLRFVLVTFVKKRPNNNRTKKSNWRAKNSFSLKYRFALHCLEDRIVLNNGEVGVKKK